MRSRNHLAPIIVIGGILGACSTAPIATRAPESLESTRAAVGPACTDDADCPTATPACCGGVCTNSNDDPKNCGACGSVCRTGICTAGACACPGALAVCGGKCLDTNTDPNNCGGCGVTCTDGAKCVAGDCQCASSASSSCKCQPVGLLGRCNADNPCCDGNSCNHGRCEAPLGHACTRNTDCASPNICDAGTCRALPGAKCTSKAGCARSGSCMGGVCAVSCATPADCPGGVSCSSKTRACESPGPMACISVFGGDPDTGDPGPCDIPGWCRSSYVVGDPDQDGLLYWVSCPPKPGIGCVGGEWVTPGPPTDIQVGQGLRCW